jgi:hypothetical protein
LIQKRKNHNDDVGDGNDDENDDDDDVNMQQPTLWSDAFQAERGGDDFDTSDE